MHAGELIIAVFRPVCTGVISLCLWGISPKYFASFPHQVASSPHQICFISPTNCFVSPTKCCISPTNCCISPTIFSFPQHNFVSLCQKIKSSKFRHLLIKIRIPDICDSGHGDDGLKSVPNDPPLPPPRRRHCAHYILMNTKLSRGIRHPSGPLAISIWAEWKYFHSSWS